MDSWITKHLFFLILLPSVTLAQETPNEFYPKGYVTSNDRIEQSPQKKQLNKRKTKTSEPSETKSDHNFIELSEDEYLDEEPPSHLEKSELLPISKLSIVLNGADKAHFDTFLKLYHEITVKYSLPTGTIYSVGGLENLSQLSQLWVPLTVSGATFELLEKAPYELQRSPSWIIDTEKGRVLLEGEEDLKKHLNAKGLLKLYISKK